MTSVRPATSDAAGTPLPAPTGPPTAPDTRSRGGRLTDTWRTILALGWAGAFFAFAAVWKASEEIGIATWWLGPRSDPQPLAIRLLPFVLALGVGVVVAYNVAGAIWVSLAGAIGIAAIATLDLSRSTGLAVIEYAIAGAVALVTAAAFGGRYPRARTGDDAIAQR